MAGKCGARHLEGGFPLGKSRKIIPLRGDWNWIMTTQIASSSRNYIQRNCSRLARALLVLNRLVLGLLPLAVTAQPACVSPPAGLIGWWRGEGNGNDSAGTNNAYSMPNVYFTNGIVGQAFAVETPGPYAGVRIADQPYYALTNSLSIEGWIRPRAAGYCIFYRGDNRPGLDPYSMSMGLNNILSFGITDASGNSAGVSAPLSYNQWWYVVGTLDGASGKLSLYTNGTLAAQITTTVRPLGNLNAQGSPGIGIGNVNDGLNNFPFNGDIDEISLYNRALSASEIQAIYNADGLGKCNVPPSGCAPTPSGLIAWWKGDGNGNDIAGTNNAYSMPNVYFTNGIVGQAFAVETLGPYAGVRVADQPYYALTNSLSIEGWIRPRAAGYYIFYRGDNRPGLDPYAMSMGLNNILGFGITDANGNSAGVSAPLSYNQWWYVVGTLDDASGKLSLYTNGTLAAQITTTVRPLGNLNAQDSPGIGIGNVNDGLNNFPFNGDIDEISLYSRALSSAEIAAIYDAGSAGKCLAPPNRAPVARCADVTVSAGTNCMANASIDNGSYDPDGDPIALSQSPTGPYPLGTNLVNLTVTDNHGASNSSSALVIVLDSTPPTIACPASLTVQAQSPTGTVVSYVVTASDTCSAVSVAVTPASGSVFPIGDTPVQATAVDAWGNSNQCVFTVTVSVHESARLFYAARGSGRVVAGGRQWQ